MGICNGLSFRNFGILQYGKINRFSASNSQDIKGYENCNKLQQNIEIDDNCKIDISYFSWNSSSIIFRYIAKNVTELNLLKEEAF